MKKNNFGHLTIISKSRTHLSGINTTVDYIIQIINDGDIIAKNMKFSAIISNCYQTESFLINDTQQYINVNSQSKIKIGSISPGEKYIIHVGQQTNQKLPNFPFASIKAVVDCDFSTQQGEPDVSKTFESNVASVQMSNSKIPYIECSTNMAQAGDEISYKITLYGGSVGYKNLILKSNIPHQLICKSFIDDGNKKIKADLNNGVSLSDLPANQNKNIFYTLKVNESFPYLINNFQNTNTITGIAQFESPENFMIGTPVISTYICKYELTLKNIIDSINLKVGQEIMCIISIQNTGNWEAKNITIKEILPEGLSFIPNSLYINSKHMIENPTVGINLEKINVYEIVNIVFKVKADQDLNKGTVSCVATSTADFYKNENQLPITKTFNSNFVNIDTSN